MRDQLEGRTITNVRQMTKQEAEAEHWPSREHHRPPVLELDDGSILYPSQDPEGNGPGALFGDTGDKAFWVPPKPLEEVEVND